MRAWVFMMLAALALVGVAFGQNGTGTGIEWFSPQTWNTGGAWLLIGAALWWLKTDGTKLLASWIEAQKQQAVAAVKMADAVEHLDRLAEKYLVGHEGEVKK